MIILLIFRYISTDFLGRVGAEPIKTWDVALDLKGDGKQLLIHLGSALSSRYFIKFEEEAVQKMLSAIHAAVINLIFA